MKIDYGGGRNQGKTERLIKEAYNKAIEDAANLAEISCDQGYYVGTKIRELKK